MDRRDALKNMAYFLWLPFVWLIYKMEGRQNAGRDRDSIIHVSKDFPEGITFFDSVIACRQNKKVHFLSSTCTHLGCRIQKEEAGILVCPCHGSRYDISGKNIKGPAVQALEILAYRKDPKTGDYLVETHAL